jgi:hypothetical protein
VRGARAAALLLVLPFAGCIFAVDHGSRKGLEKRIDKLEKRIQDIEKGRGHSEGRKDSSFRTWYQ